MKVLFVFNSLKTVLSFSKNYNLLCLEDSTFPQNLSQILNFVIMNILSVCHYCIILDWGTCIGNITNVIDFQLKHQSFHIHINVAPFKISFVVRSTASLRHVQLPWILSNNCFLRLSCMAKPCPLKGDFMLENCQNAFGNISEEEEGGQTREYQLGQVIWYYPGLSCFMKVNFLY